MFIFQTIVIVCRILNAFFYVSALLLCLHQAIDLCIQSAVYSSSLSSCTYRISYVEAGCRCVLIYFCMLDMFETVSFQMYNTQYNIQLAAVTYRLHMLDKEHLTVSWSICYQDIRSRQFEPCRLWGGVFVDCTCFPQIPSDPIRLVFEEFGSQAYTLDSFSCSCSLSCPSFVFAEPTAFLLGETATVGKCFSNIGGCG